MMSFLHNRLRLLAALWALVLAASGVRAQTPTDADWTGTWVGTYSYLTPCGFTNFGNITLNFYVAGGSVTGSGLEDTVTCYDGSCNVLGFGTFSGNINGYTSNNTVNVGGSWLDTCNSQNYTMLYNGTLNNGILSGPNNTYLQRLPTTNICIVDPSYVFQRIDGFGAACAFLGPFTTAQADMFFSTNVGIGLSLIRSRIAPDGTTAEADIMQMAQARGAKVWSSPWSPPGAYKDSGSIDGGNFLSQFNQPYANQLADYVVNMKNQYGINIYAVSVQNEPDYNTFNYESCVWTGQKIHDFIPYFSQALSNNGVGSTKIMIAEEAGWLFDETTTAEQDPAVSNDVSILAGHGYFSSAAPVFTGNTALWETETSGFGAFDGSMADGIYWGQQVHDFMTIANANAFHYWWLMATGGDNEGLTDEYGNPAKRMYAIGQFSRFVRPGFNRIGAFNEGDCSITAYQDPVTGNFAIVAINPDAQALNQTFQLNFPAGLLTPWMTTADVSMAMQSNIFVNNGTFTYSLPAQSIVTFVGQTNDVTITSQPQSQSVAAGDTVTFSMSAQGAPPLNYSWQLNGVAISGATNPVYTLTNVPASDNGGQFVCIISNAFGITASSIATLTVANPFHAFNGADGSNPSGALVQTSDGTLYGTTQNGGAYGFGTIFALTPGGNFNSLVSFNNTNGAMPAAGLTKATDGNLYGTTSTGGASGWGTVFKMTPGGQLSTLYSFDSSQGIGPQSPLVQGTDGYLYGTFGEEIFKISTNGAYTNLAAADFSVAGATPVGGLIQGTNGNFYGVTSSGEANDNGVIFSMTPGGTLSTVASFAGSGPFAGLLQADNGNYYGTTCIVPSLDSGSIFEMTPTGSVTTLFDFDPSTSSGGSRPFAGVIQADDGNFYGTTTSGGAYSNGTVFVTYIDNRTLTLQAFRGIDGAQPESSLIQGADGSFYGTAPYGGIGWNGVEESGYGVVYTAPFPNLPSISVEPVNQSTSIGGTSTFTVGVTGGGDLQYTWLKNGAVISDANGTSLTVTNAGSASLGNYTVIISNAVGSVTSLVATLSITNFVCTEPPYGITSWWPGESNAVDRISGQNGVLAGSGPNFAKGFVGNGFYFNGGTNYVQLPVNLFPPAGAGPFSIELWFETATGGVILEQQAGTPFAGVPNGWVPMLYVGTDGHLYAQLIWDYAFAQISTTTPVNDGGFHHVAVTYDGNNEAVYVDGTEIGAEIMPYSTYSKGFACQLGTGYTAGWPAGGNGWFSFNGILDEFTLYTNALTDGQILSIYNAGTAGKCTDELSPIINSQPTNQSVIAGANATFAVSATSLEALTYQWFDGSNALAGATNPVLTLSRVTSQNAGNYEVVVSNFYGVVTSAVATLTVTNAPCAAAPPGIISWWPGESNTLDVVGANNGSVFGAVYYGPGEVGDGFLFTGAPGCVVLPSNIYPLPGGAPFSIELWFATTAGGVILEQQNGAAFNGTPNGWVPNLYVGTDGNLYAQLFWNGSFQQLVTTHPVNDGANHHVALTYDGANQAMYVDGAQIGTEPLAYSTYAANFACQIGTGFAEGWPAGVNGWFDFIGIIDEVTLYNNALTPAQVLSIYSAGSEGKCLGGAMPVIVTQPTNVTVVAGNTAVFNVAATSTSPIAYQWAQNSNPVSGATNTTYALTNVPLSDTGVQIVCQVSTSGGATNTSTAVLNVIPSAISLTNVLNLNNGTLQMTITGLPGLEFRVLDSTNLTSWQTLATLTNVTGTINFTDSIPANAPCRYYELTSP